MNSGKTNGLGGLFRKSLICGLLMASFGSAEANEAQQSPNLSDRILTVKIGSNLSKLVYVTITTQQSDTMNNQKEHFLNAFEKIYQLQDLRNIEAVSHILGVGLLEKPNGYVVSTNKSDIWLSYQKYGHKQVYVNHVKRFLLANLEISSSSCVLPNEISSIVKSLPIKRNYTQQSIVDSDQFHEIYPEQFGPDKTSFEVSFNANRTVACIKSLTLSQFYGE